MIDIIVPVYNAYDDLVKCADSIDRWTDFSMARVVFIDDCSTDPRVFALLQEMENKYFHVLRTDSNGGFPKTVNIGIAYSENDVVLLNTDTIVTKNWVEKLRNCAYRDNAVGTVTPLSNNASICSVPEFLKNNELPKNMSIDEVAELVERTSLCEYPEIPVAVGFCMYIRRALIEDIGNLNEIDFHIGYGEENDFSYRAEQVGYKNLLCDDTYIFHTGGASFQSTEKKIKISENTKILKERYAKQEQLTQEFMRDNLLYGIQKNLWYHLLTRNGKRNILQVVHSDFKEGTSQNIGGTQMHVKDIVQNTTEEFNQFVLAREENFILLTIYVGKEIIPFRFQLQNTYTWNLFSDKVYSEIVSTILKGFSIDLVHVQHLKGHTFDIFFESKKLEIPVVCTIHDYYFVCPNFISLNPSGKRCFEPEETDCLSCTKEGEYSADITSIWKKRAYSALLNCNKIFAPSQSVKTLLSKTYPNLYDEIKVISHGCDIPPEIKPVQRPLADKEIKIAFIGGMAEIKGSKIVYEMMQSNKDKQIFWYIMGLIGDVALFHLERSDLYKHGVYQREEIYSLLQENKIDLVCILSIVPETFCYTLSESLACGIPVLVTDIGALGDRVREAGCGWVVPANAGSKQILEMIEYIRNNPKEYNEKRKATNELVLKTAAEMAQEYADEYIEIRQFVKNKSTFDTQLLYKAFCFENSASNNEQASFFYQRMVIVQNENTAIKNSFTYRFMQKIAKIPIPFKGLLKRLIVKTYKIFQK